MIKKKKCLQCGKCCETIRLSVSFDKLPLPYKNFLIPITLEEATGKNPYMETWILLAKRNNHYIGYFYKCCYQTADGKCRAHSNNNYDYMCKEFPYYNKKEKEIDYFALYNPLCGFNTIKNNEKINKIIGV